MDWILLFIVIGLVIYFLKSNQSSSTNKRRNKSTNGEKKKSNSNRRARNIPNVEISGGMLDVRSIEFFGPCNRSKNEIFSVGWQDSNYKAGFGETYRGGFRNDGMGRIILLENKKVKWEKEFERPNNAKVSNEGYVALNDWLFSGDLEGKFYLLNPDGKILIEDKLSANLLDPGITPDSKLAWTLTARSENSDSNQLFVYDGNNCSRLFKRDKLYGKIEKSVMVDGYIEFTTSYDVYYKFDINGKLLNKNEVELQIENHKLNSNNLRAVHSVAKEKIAEYDSNKFDKEKGLKIIEKLQKLESDVKDKHLAKTFRYQGELKLILEKKKEALSDFEKALELDSKVGVKRKTKKLRKELKP